MKSAFGYPYQPYHPPYPIGGKNSKLPPRGKVKLESLTNPPRVAPAGRAESPQRVLSVKALPAIPKYPLEVSLVARCCGTKLPYARVVVGKEVMGSTGASGEPVECEVCHGELTLKIKHALATESLRSVVPFFPDSPGKVAANLSPARLHFICSRRKGSACIDLWLVGGKVDAWRCSRHGPRADEEVWMFNGELPIQSQDASSSSTDAADSDGVLIVDGVLSPASAGAPRADDAESSVCILSRNLFATKGSIGPWDIAYHPAEPSSECVMAQLSKLTPPYALWLARLGASYPAGTEEGEGDPDAGSGIFVYADCCGRGWGCVCASTQSCALRSVGEDGVLAWPKDCRSDILKLDGIPQALLPGGTCEYSGALHPQRGVWDLPVRCGVWVYWVPPEGYEVDAFKLAIAALAKEKEVVQDKEEDNALGDGKIYLAADPNHIPKGALPLKGMLLCPGAEWEEQALHGESLGPFWLRAAPSLSLHESSDCILSKLRLQVEPDDGLLFREELPCPLDLGDAGCVLQHIAVEPVVLGHFKVIPPPEKCRVWIYAIWAGPDQRPRDPTTSDFSVGTIWLAIQKDHIPENALPVKGEVHCDGAIVEDVSLTGHSMGPFEFERARTEGDVLEKHPSLLSSLTFAVENNVYRTTLPHEIGDPARSPESVRPVEMEKLFEYRPAAQSLLEAGSEELGGSEIQRLLKEPVMLGEVVPFPTPLRSVCFIAQCCGHGFADLHVVAGGKDAGYSAVSGMLELPMSRVGQCMLQLDGAPRSLLPKEGVDLLTEWQLPGETLEECQEFPIQCMVWLYTTTDESDDADDVDPPTRTVWVAADPEHLPEGAEPVKGSVCLPWISPNVMKLEGTGFGPFFPSSIPNDFDEPVPCMLGQLALQVEPEQYFEYCPRDPSPLQERCNELKGCELPRLLKCPAALGQIQPLSTPIRSLRFLSTCCGRGFCGVAVTADGQLAGSSDTGGVVMLPKSRAADCYVQISGLPEQLIPSGAGAFKTTWRMPGEVTEECQDQHVHCLLWVYCTTLPHEIGDDDVDPPKRAVWIAADPAHIPESALAVKGMLSCSETGYEEYLNGKSMGPFPLALSDGAVTPRTPRQCLASIISLEVDAEKLFEYQPVARCPLAARCEELGGCEFQRLLKEPLVLGHIVPLPTPTRSIRFIAQCCGNGFEGVHVIAAGKDAGYSAVSGMLQLPKSRVGTCLLQLDDVPHCLLPYEGADLLTNWQLPGETREECQDFAMQCLVWLYTTTNDSDDAEGVDPPTRTVWVAADPEHLPEGAEPVKGSLRLPWISPNPRELTGSTFGPFFASGRLASREFAEPVPCMLGQLALQVEPEQYFEYCPRDPSPLQERCDELQGCELQRLLKCPAALGRIQPLPTPIRSLRFLCTCCGRGLSGVAVTADSKAAGSTDAGGVVMLPRSRKAECTIQMAGLPEQLMPHGSGVLETTWRMPGEVTEECQDLHVHCLLWVYCVRPEHKFVDDGSDEPDPPDQTIWVVSDPDAIPKDAVALEGELLCPWAESPCVELDGSSMGPFPLQEDYFTRLTVATPCPLADLSLRAVPQTYFEYVQQQPSPLAEYCSEHGDCALPQLLAGAIEVARFKPLPTPIRKVRFLAQCCNRGLTGIHVAVEGCAAGTSASDGTVTLPRSRARERTLMVSGIADCMLPDGAPETTTVWKMPGEVKEECQDMPIECMVWVCCVVPEHTFVDDGSDEPDPPVRQIWLGSDPNTMPANAVPVRGSLRCPWSAEQPSVDLDGLSLGPFHLPALSASQLAPDTPCPLSQMSMLVEAERMFFYVAANPSPLADGCQDFGGCNLQRLLSGGAVMMGEFHPYPTPVRKVRFKAQCCGNTLSGIGVSIKGRDQGTSDAQDGGFVQLPRSRQPTCELCTTGLPPNLLPGKGRLPMKWKIPGQVEEERQDLVILCSVWIFVIEQDDPEDKAEASGEVAEDVDPGDSLKDLGVFVALDPKQIPAHAKPVHGRLAFADVGGDLDPNSFGPYEVCKTETTEIADPCLLGELSLEPDPLDHYNYHSIEPSPLQELCKEFGGCQLTRLVEKPIELGRYKPFATPKRYMKFTSRCCGRGLAGVVAHSQDRKLGVSNANGLLKMPPSRAVECAMKLSGLPMPILPGDNGALLTTWKPPSPGEMVEETKEISISCSVWMYCMPGAEEEETDAAADEELAEKEPSELSIWLSVNPDHIPEGARPFKGALTWPSEVAPVRQVLDGLSMGPFKFPGHPPEAGLCSLADLKVEATPHDLFWYSPYDPSPLHERCSELGGCEFQRLLSVPVVVGHLKPFPTPQRGLRFLTQCCSRAVPHIEARMRNRLIGSTDEAGFLKLPASRGTESIVECTKLPTHLLPGSEGKLTSTWKLPGELTEEVQEAEVRCSVWLYATVDEEEEDEEADGEADAASESTREPPGIRVWVSVDPEQVPSEAQAVRGHLRCQAAVISLDGKSLGPFAFDVAADASLPDDERVCLLSELSVEVESKPFYQYHPKEPSPLKERCVELGGCELLRMLMCPVVIGYFKPFPTASRSLRFRTMCCGRPMPGIGVQANGRELGQSNEDGCIQLLPSRKETCPLVLSSLPPALLPGDEGALDTTWRAPDPSVLEEQQDILIQCLVWIYATTEEADEYDEEESEEPRSSAIWVAVNPEHIPDEARAIRGELTCPWSKGQVTVLDGQTVGPFPSPPLPSEAADQEMCLLANLKLTASPDPFFEFVAKDPSPLMERCSELEGCEFQRLLAVPMVIGYFRPFPTPVRTLHFRTQCCGCSMEGVHVTAGGVEIGASNCDGLVQLNPSRAASCQLKFADIPLELLPGDKGVLDTNWKLPGEAAEECQEMLVHCLVWIYSVVAEIDPDEEGEEISDEPQDITIWVAVDPDQIPDEAQPVRGLLTLPWAEENELHLDGRSLGPFPVAKSTTLPEAPEHCLLSRLTLKAEPEGLYQYEPKDPSPLEERCDELGGCELARLLACPMVIGHFKPLPTPTRTLHFTSSCCGRGCAGVSVSANGISVGKSDDLGMVHLPPNRTSVCQLALSDMPSALLPGSEGELETRWKIPGEALEEQQELVVSCLIWVYSVPPDQGEEDGEGDDDMLDETIWVAVNPEHIPDEAKPVKGVLECPWAKHPSIKLDGKSLGPFPYGASREPEADQTCSMSGLILTAVPEPFFQYVAKDPSPLLERSLELGGCELQRLLACPVVIGHFRPFPTPARSLCFQMQCCGRPVAGMKAAVDGTDVGASDADGVIHLPPNRTSACSVKLSSFPTPLLPGADGQLDLTWKLPGAATEECQNLAVKCLVWLYSIPPDSEEDDELLDEAIWVAVDPEHIPDEAKPVKGQLSCPWAAEKLVALDGLSMGPFPITANAVEPQSEAMCSMSGLALTAEPPACFEFIPKDPSPLLERCQELDGCEFLRLLAVPVVIGYFRPLPTPVRSLHFQTQCCRCNVEGVGVRADGVEIGKTDSEGMLQLPPNRSKTCELQFSGFPTDLLPGESGKTSSTWKLPGETSEECQDRLLHCLVWIYAVPPDEEEQEEGEDTEPLDTTIWVAVNPEQIPDEAQPVRGTLTLPWTKEKQVKLDGSTTGPFPLSKVPDLPEAESHCLFARLALHCEPDGAFQFVAKDPSPLTERCTELEGCELLRLLACPVVVGYFKPIKK